MLRLVLRVLAVATIAVSIAAVGAVTAVTLTGRGTPDLASSVTGSMPAPTHAGRPIPTADFAVEELAVFLDWYACPQLGARQDAATTAWDRFRGTGTRVDAEAAFAAQREVIALLDRFPRPTLARELHDALIRSEEMFLEAIAAYDHSLHGDATQPTLHLRLISEHNASARRVRDLAADLARVHRLPAPATRESGVCLFLR